MSSRGFGLLLLLLLPFIMMGGQGEWVDSISLDTHNQYIELAPGMDLTQTYNALGKEVSGVKFLIGPTEHRTQGTFRIYDSVGVSLFDRTFTIMPNQNVLTFNFEAVQPLGGEYMKFVFIAAAVNENSIRLIQSNTPLEDAILYHNNDWADQQLVFQVATENSKQLIDLWGTTFQNMSQYKPTWTKTPWLYFYWFGFVLLSWGWLQLIKAKLVNPIDNPPVSSLD
jgi:hypothetical protein